MNLLVQIAAVLVFLGAEFALYELLFSREAKRQHQEGYLRRTYGSASKTLESDSNGE